MQQHFTSLPGEERQLELLRLANWLVKAMAGGSTLLIVHPDGSIERIAYGQQYDRPGGRMQGPFLAAPCARAQASSEGPANRQCRQ